MSQIKNILFVMYDQLRHDYLSCAGHPTMKTPNFDRLAARGVRFTRAYVQSPICGASRMSFYTGRYVHSHGAAWNNFPLKVGEMTMGDHLRKLGVDSWLVGKTHMSVDAEGMARLGLAPESVIGARVADCGFDVWVREDGLNAEGPEGFYDEKRSPYNEWLKQQGYPGHNPWHVHANAGVDAQGDIASGWLLQNAVQPANIREEDSETPWLTARAMEFIAKDHAAPWLCHLSYIKPHWPYIVPAPWHNLYGPADVVPPLRDAREKDDPHPVFNAFMNNQPGQAFSRDEVRAAVIPAYMGLIAQCDAEFGKLLDFLEETGRMNETMIVLTSDHGDYLGDHWMGEKDLFHDPSVRIPLVIYDPRHAADATRGTTCDALVEAIDLAPTFVQAMGGAPADHILEGRDLTPLLHGQTPDWRAAVFSEYDYSAMAIAGPGYLDVAPEDARLFMVFDGRWKLIHAEGGFRPMLFDTASDPNEFTDLGSVAAHQPEIARLMALLNDWARRPAQRTTISKAQIKGMRGKSRRVGVIIGAVAPEELAPDLRAKISGRPEKDFRQKP
ncbi:MAG: sulfatase-like hydrolase/transferase [Rhodobacteraceae bacterium]|nr:sulfatase-like hydrolase/transferase [Paracoccaceae bacterium]